jgi:hypothetical protein
MRIAGKLMDAPKRLGTGTSVIGLDLGTSTVKAAQAATVRGTIAWRRATIPRDEPGCVYGAAEFGRIAGALRRNGFTGAQVAIVAPRDSVRTSTIDLPAGQPPALRAASARAELSEMHGLNPSAFEMIVWPGPQPPRATPVDRLIAVVCAHDTANTLLDAAESAGLDPAALSPAPLALATAARDTIGDGLACVLDLGWSGASLTAVRNGLPIFDRPLGGTSLAKLCEQPIAGASLSPADASWIVGVGRVREPGAARAVANVLARYAEAVGAELRASMNYLAQCLPNDRPDLVLVAGGPASDGDLISLIEAHSGVSVRGWNDDDGGRRATLARGAAVLETPWLARSTDPQQPQTPRPGEGVAA